jgi:peptide chain release factor 1
MHIPTGIRVFCQQSRSQQQNRELAMTLLRAKLYDLELTKRRIEVDNIRNSQIGSGSRSEKIRTYNWKDNRVTDHRLNINIPLAICIAGNLDEIHLKCKLYMQQYALQEMTND